MLAHMAKFGPMVWSGNGLEIYASVPRATRKGVQKVWIRVQGAVGTTLRVYESLGYARSVDVCFMQDATLKPRKRRKSGP
jgi:hypothetical protein